VEVVEGRTLEFETGEVLRVKTLPNWSQGGHYGSNEDKQGEKESSCKEENGNQEEKVSHTF
jgi:hypothetical protein